MIDTNKLLSNRSGGSTTLSRKSVINIGLIREDVIKIDGLLKSRLVLSKVRDGIEKQSLERLKRKKSEDDLESEVCDCDDDDRRRDPDPKPKKGRGLIGFLIGGALAVIGGIAMKFLPIILSLGKFIGRIAKVFTFVVGGAFTAIGSFISLFNDSSKQLKGVDKDQLDEGYVNDVFTNFNGAIRNVVLGIIAAAGAAAIVRAFMMKRMMSPDVFFDKMILARRGSKQLTDEELIRATAKKLGLNIDEFMEPIDRASARKRNISRTLEEAKEVIPNRKPKVQYEDFLGMNKPKKGVQVTESPVDLLQRQRQRSARRIKTNLTNKQIQEALDKSRVADLLDPEDYVRFPRRLDELTDSTKTILKKFSPNNVNLRKTLNDLANDVDPFDKRKFFSIDPEFGFQLEDPFSKLNTKKILNNKQILEGTNLLKAPIIKDLKPEQLLKRGGGSILLKQIGGEAFAASFKQGLKAAVGPIPFFGDLIGVLLDIFVFGEPVGRAIFKGVGSFAIAALLAALGFAIGGPVGAFIGGVAGGIGGDILGGIVYDLFFGKNANTNFRKKNRPYVAGVTKAGAKALTQYGDGGYVGEPSFKPLVNSVDKSINLRTTPSYARGGGKVKFIPLPIPIPTKGQSQEEEEQQLSVTSNTIETKTFAGLYER